MMTPGNELPGGRMTWSEAVTGPLAGCTCLWQDLDGLHVAAAPSGPPPTSILWGWRGESALVRVRMDGDTAYVAVSDPAGPGMVATVPWAVTDGRVAAARGPERADGGVGARYEQVVVGGIESGPITFIRPVRDA
jgi:hypothetical protein